MGWLDGLLGSSMDDPKTTATLALAQGLLSGPRALPAISGGLLNYNQSMQQSKQQQQAEELRAMQIQQHQIMLAQAQREAQRQQQLQALAPQFARTATQNALTAGGGPTKAAASAMETAQPSYDFAGYAQALAPIDPMASLQLQASLKKERPKIKEFKEVRGSDGSVQIVGLDEYGTPVQTGQTPFKEGREVDLGGAKYERDPITGKLTLIGKKTLTPGETASNGLGWARLNFDKNNANNAVSWQQDADGNYVGLPTKLNGSGPVRAIPAIAPGGMTPLQGKGAGLTEDQGKATGWLAQAENAFKNMKSAMTSTPGAERPGLNDVIGAVPLMGPVANMMRGADRQKFMQASSSFGEAVLRAATGAGVNKDEAAQKARELTPQIGDSQDVIEQKMAAFPIYLESLKVRAGPGAKKAAAIFQSPAAQPIPGLKFLGFEGQ